MKTQSRRYAIYIKFALYAAVVVLINLAGQTLFQRFDLTANKAFTLSDISKEVVSTLKEPLTIKAFFSQTLPPPHNTTEQYLQDLLKEYAINGNRYFNYSFHNVSGDTEGSIGETAQANREMARSYGINPVQIQLIENDEIKFQQVYMGLVMIHGDTIERIPAITATDGLEYQLTTAMQKLNNKVSALLNLEDKVQVELVLSSSIFKVAPLMGLNELKDYPDEIKEVVDKLNAPMYGKLAFRMIDPEMDAEAARAIADEDLMTLDWPAVKEANVDAGRGTIGMLIRYQDQVRSVPLLHVMRIPLIGTQYKLTESREVEELINVNVERLVKINEDIGYLADFGTPGLQGFGAMGPQSGNNLERFNAVAGKTYNLKPIYLKENPIPDGLKCLIIAGPTETLPDYYLYQIDQALMRGTNLAVFVDAFRETQPGQQPYMANQGIMMLPLNTGLEKLLAHYGVRVKKSIVMDEKCYRQRMPQNRGGGEQALYFAPIVQNENINHDLPVIQNIRGLITLKISPLELDAKRIEAQQLEAIQLFTSSDRSWEMRDNISLNPMFLRPPTSDKEMGSQPLAYLLEGSFASYFDGKPMPEKPAEKKDDPAEGDDPEAAKDQPSDAVPDIAQQGAFKAKSPAGKILVIASSEMVKDSLFDEEGRTTNAIFVMNMLDELNNNESMALMRSKEKLYNPLKETTPGTKNGIKAFNIFGLPILVVLFGVIVWFRRHSRRKRIQLQFQQ